MLPNFTGVLAIRFHIPYSDRVWSYRPYVNGKRLQNWDCETREDAENELAEELEDLAVKGDGGDE